MNEFGGITTRRQFLASTTAMAAASVLSSGSELLAQGPGAERAKLEQKLATDPRRPQFHLLPAKNWMNDPNGPIYFNGKYHMFCQYNPLAPVWGDMSWNHAVSADMLHWAHLPLALTPTPGSPDSFGCFSGSAIQVAKRVYQVYTGTKLGPKELATIRDGEDKIQESQCLAWSDDPELVRWTKLPQPIIPTPPEGMRITGFRDPSAWKQGRWYYATVGAGEAGVGGCVLLYRTRDLHDPRSWVYLHKLTSGAWNGHKTPNPCDDGEMWECPDFFALRGGHVLIYSTERKVFWQSGKLDPNAMTFVAEKTGELDLGAFYAPKTQLDARGRRILWGWIPERRSDAEMTEAGWSGMMSLPRVLSLDPDGTLRVQVLPDTSALRSGVVGSTVIAKGESTVLSNATGEALCAGSQGSRFEFTMRNGDTDLLRCVYKPVEHTFSVDGMETRLNRDDLPTLHAFVDGSVVELIVSSRVGYTKRFYYPGRTAPDISLLASGEGVKLKGWRIGPISPNRLTTPAREL